MQKQQLIDMGHRLRQRRTELGLTREKMAELADIGMGYYGQLEVGTLIKLSRAMHLPMEYIVLGEGEPRGDASAVQDMLDRCSARELRLAEEVLKLFLMKQN